MPAEMKKRPKYAAKGRPKSRKKRYRRKGPSPMVVAAGLIVLLGVAAVILSRGGTPTGKVVGAVTISGASLPEFTKAMSDGQAPDTSIGLVVPELSGTDFAGNPVEVRHDGRPKAIVFLAHWCPHCQNEVPQVQAWLNNKGMPKDVDLISVSTAVRPSSPNYPPDKWLQREGWTLPVLRDDKNSSAAAAHGLTGYPYWIFVDRDGKVVLRTSGELPLDRLEQILARLAAPAP
ncbi:MAG: TlpA family protein disulfide reductase [Acidobacteria bacterium]|nr:TlpA family protein disulfide reductase [Acidobacteriota bacterium]